MKNPFSRFSGMSLRNRIAFYYTGATAILIALVFSSIYFTVQSIVYKQFDDEINHDIQELLPESKGDSYSFRGFEHIPDLQRDEHDDDDSLPGNLQPSPTGVASSAKQPPHPDKHEKKRRKRKRKETVTLDTKFIQFVNTNGEVLNKSASLSWCVLSFNPNQSGTSYFNNNFGGTPVRQAQIPLINEHGNIEGFLIIAIPLKNALIVLHDLRDIFLFSFPAILLTLFALTRLIAGKSIQPIEEVITTAETMSQTNLGQRITLPFHHDELYRLSATINALFDRLQDAFVREKHFTSDASHELKTPLAIVKGTLDVLVRKPRTQEHYETKIHFCLKELNRMARLIDQLLMLARHESNKVKAQIETVALPILVETVTERMEQAAEAKKISIALHYPGQLYVAADPGMLDMMIENIIANAIKYSPEGSAISVEIQQVGQSIFCTIRDQGIGIPEEKLHSIFDRFYRVDESRSSKTGGLGLGLSIVKKLADLQHIIVSVASGINTGTTFTITFPADTVPGTIPTPSLTE